MPQIPDPQMIMVQLYGLPIGTDVDALTKAATAAGLTTPQARLVVAINQMEELFATDADPAARAVFVRVLASLATSGRVWVVATLRADFFHR